MKCKLASNQLPEDKRRLSKDNSSSTGKQSYFPYGDAVTTGEAQRNKQHVQIMNMEVMVPSMSSLVTSTLEHLKQMMKKQKFHIG